MLLSCQAFVRPVVGSVERRARSRARWFLVQMLLRKRFWHSGGSSGDDIGGRLEGGPPGSGAGVAATAVVAADNSNGTTGNRNWNGGAVQWALIRQATIWFTIRSVAMLPPRPRLRPRHPRNSGNRRGRNGAGRHGSGWFSGPVAVDDVDHSRASTESLTSGSAVSVSVIAEPSNCSKIGLSCSQALGCCSAYLRRASLP